MKSFTSYFLAVCHLMQRIASFFSLFVHVKLSYFCASFNEIRAPTTVFSFPLTESAIEDETNEKILFSCLLFVC